ncbi:carbohydrate esterase family 4 protein [Suillus paluster]|uniref:carbohydrate esterase family 4 protein n=1 Tax=Suillus paluster TaxID=48578 RepID=UPI001B876DB7|nr:carbohydrate esterase family 4 protein [Suillus paluster]KAG1754040.1 carbohydrate esterase family 4 protein [Suillus paluster]
MSRLSAILLLATSAVYASVAPTSVFPTHESHTENKTSRNKWYHEDDHPLHALFKRGPVGDSITYPVIGTPSWSAGFPQLNADTASLPQAWVDALNAAVTAGKVPDVPQSTSINGTDPVYPTGSDPMSAAVCSSTYKCVTPGDVWNALPGVVALSFDDGPQLASDQLYQFLANHSEHATHFFIGTNILLYPDQFKTAFETNQDDIAVHTWTHPYMTTKTNLEVLAELGWTIELIHNSTGGRIPKYWRPPYGDSDMRIRAIAKEVFGLTTVIWNQDTDDWSLSEPNPLTTPEKIQQQMTQWLTGPKSPGLVILEHELSDLSVKSFMDAYPMMVSNGWTRTSLAQLDGGAVYQNAWNSTSQVNQAKVGDLAVKPPARASTSAKPSATSARK